MTQIIRCDNDDTIAKFIKIPSLFYSEENITGSRDEEEQLLRGTHFLNKYLTLFGFIAVDGDKLLGRCAITEYENDDTAYFGFFECVDDSEIAKELISYAENYAKEKGYKFLDGPLDASLWIKYRFKTNKFDLPPYCGEPYNLPYYEKLFLDNGFSVKENYVSNQYKKLPEKNYEIPKYKERYDTFIKNGYIIRSPERKEWDKCSREVYRMIAKLYTNFLTYKPITEDEFADYFSFFKTIADMSMIKMAYKDGQAVGFVMGLPNYSNMASRRRTLGIILKLLSMRHKAKEYVILYMGVEKEHQGLGKALTHAIMIELAKKQASSIGSLIRNGNINYNYADEDMEDRYHYVFMEKVLNA